MNTWRARGPNLLEPQRRCAPSDSNRATKSPACCRTFYLICTGEDGTGKKKKSVGAAEFVRERERHRGACRLTVCQTTRSAHPRRGVGFLIEYSYLKPRSLFCGCERDRKVGPDRDSFSTWPMYRFDELHRLNESVTTC